MPVSQCPICTKTDEVRASTGPNWFLQRMDKVGAPPYGWSLNGTPLLTRSGDPIKGERRQRVMMPVYDPCNGTINIFDYAADRAAREGLSPGHAREISYP